MPQASPESTPAFLLDLDRVPSAATALQVTVAALSPAVAVSWLGLDGGQVDLLGKRPLFTGKLSGCLATNGQARKGGRLQAISGLGSWLP